MADLTDLQASGTVKVVGASSSGLEGTPVKSSLNGDLGVSDIVDNGGLHGSLSVSTTAVAVRVGASNLVNRKVLMFHNNGTGTLYWGYNNTVNSSNGMPLKKDQFCVGDWGPGTTIYIIASSGTHNLRVNEGA